MGKLLPLLLTIAAIEISLSLFLGISTPGTSILNLVTNLELWSETSLIIKITTLTAGAALAGIIVGTVWFKNDFLIYGSLAGLFLTYGAMFFELKTKIDANPYFSGTPVTLFIMTPLVLTYLYVVLKFWRGWD